VRGRSGITFDRIVEYDIEYVEKQSLMLDLKIMWWTFTSVVLAKGAH
jgi:lipopolysaccharide/colanic/teichoic acid biosynthesis glycosyltransferase